MNRFLNKFLKDICSTKDHCFSLNTVVTIVDNTQFCQLRTIILTTLNLVFEHIYTTTSFLFLLYPFKKHTGTCLIAWWLNDLMAFTSLFFQYFFRDSLCCFPWPFFTTDYYKATSEIYFDVASIIKALWFHMMLISFIF